MNSLPQNYNTDSRTYSIEIGENSLLQQTEQPSVIEHETLTLNETLKRYKREFVIFFRSLATDKYFVVLIAVTIVCIIIIGIRVWLLHFF